MKGPLVRLTAAKVVANTALRWIPPFLPTLERALGASTTQLTTALGIGEMAGLSTVVAGPALDRGRERAVMITGLVAISASALVALIGTIGAFGVSMVLLVTGVANFTVAGHTWISHRVDYRWRARAIGVFETSWALALLVGAPMIALLIAVIGWRAPFVTMAVGSAGAALLVATTLPRHRPDDQRDGVERAPGWSPPPDDDRVVDRRARGRRAANARVTPRALAVLLGSATMAAAGLSVFVVSGAWLEDRFGVSTGGLGAIAMAFGAVELVASTGTAAFGDRVGKMRTTLAGLALLAAGLAVMVAADDRLAVGVIGLVLFLFGFEYGFVTSLSLVSEAMPEARGRTLALGNALGTGARGTATIASGWLYGRHGIAGTAALAASAAVISLTCLLISRRAR